MRRHPCFGGVKTVVKEARRQASGTSSERYVKPHTGFALIVLQQKLYKFLN
jgi:hypothetical protein